MVEFVRKHSVRLFALVVAILALVADFAPDFPVERTLTIVAAVLALAGGEVVQRVENRKTRGE